MFSDLGTVLGILTLILVFMGMFMYIGWYLTRKPSVTLSPYTSMPLWRADLLPFSTKEKVALYLQDYRQYDNRPFKFAKAAYCRETGRIFQDCQDWKHKIVVDWTFLQKRFPGNWISWGSLSDELKESIRNRHEDLEGFQTSLSSKYPSPRQIEMHIAYAKPGPLYVDLDTAVLLGWKEVPHSLMEVLIVQKPVR
jgi:hypothetical protein